MTIQLTKHTDEYETLTRKTTDEEGNTIDEPYESEILETIREIEVTDDTKAKLSKAYKLRAELLTRDSGYKHSVRFITE